MTSGEAEDDFGVPNRIALVGYLQDALPAEQIARIEQALRESEEWRSAAYELSLELDRGEQSVATIWRRHRLTCPNRERLGAYLAGGLLPKDEEDYIRFHLDTIGCRWCQANADDLRQGIDHAAETAADDSADEVRRRRRKLFETSIRELPRSRFD